MKYKETPFGCVPEDWNVLPINEITSLVTDYVANGSFASLAENVKYKEEKDVAVLIRLVDYNRNFDGDFVYIDEHAYEFLSKSKLYGGEIIISNVGANVGTVFRCPDLPYKMSLAPNSIMVKFKGSDEFYYYWLRSPFGQHMLKSIVTGSAQPKFNKTNFRDMLAPVPPRKVQDRIVTILRTLDDKIEVNKKINKNLLQQMESLYKAWFTDFIPFGGSRPSDWRKSDIYSIADIIYGAPFSSKLFNTDGEGIPIIRIRDLRDQAFVTYTTENHPKGHLIQPGDIVVGMDGEFRPYIWGNTEAWLNQRVCIFNNKRPKGKAFVLFTIKPLLYRIEQTQVATTVIHIGKKDYDAFELYLPDSNTLDQFDELTSPMIDQIVVNRLENKRLATLRDSLLPRLMSGELDVSDIDL